MNPPPLPIRVMFLGHFEILRYGLEKLINEQKPKMEFVGGVADYSCAFLTLEKLSPDVIIIDMSHDVDKELEALSQLIAISKTKVLILKSTQNLEVLDRAIFLGAIGIIEKESTIEMIIKAIEKVHEGQFWLDHMYIKRLLHSIFLRNIGKNDAYNTHDKTGINRLTPREMSIFYTMVENAGMPAKVVASKLKISESTLSNRLTSIYKKLRINNKSQLYSYVHERKQNERL